MHSWAESAAVCREGAACTPSHHTRKSSGRRVRSTLGRVAAPRSAARHYSPAAQLAVPARWLVRGYEGAAVVGVGARHFIGSLACSRPRPASHPSLILLRLLPLVRQPNDCPFVLTSPPSPTLKPSLFCIDSTRLDSTSTSPPCQAPPVEPSPVDSIRPSVPPIALASTPTAAHTRACEICTPLCLEPPVHPRHRPGARRHSVIARARTTPATVPLDPVAL